MSNVSKVLVRIPQMLFFLIMRKNFCPEWNLEKINSKIKDEYFFTNDNTQAIVKTKSILAQAILGSMIEWNNMHKRMGELRNNPYESGV